MPVVQPGSSLRPLINNDMSTFIVIFINVSGQLIGPIVMEQVVQEVLDCLFLGDRDRQVGQNRRLLTTKLAASVV
jgi:predicted ATP-dependent serine protease